MTPTPATPALSEMVRAQLYRSFIRTGQAPSAEEVAEAVGRSAADVRGAYRALADARAVTVNGNGEIWMVHPFSACETAYRVESGGISYWANCAWDALAIAAVLRQDICATAACPDCGEAVDLSVRDARVADPTAVVHFAVPPVQFWENIGFT